MSAWNEYVDGRIASALAAHRHEVEELARASIAFAVRAQLGMLVELDDIVAAFCDRGLGPAKKPPAEACRRTRCAPPR